MTSISRPRPLALAVVLAVLVVIAPSGISMRAQSPDPASQVSMVCAALGGRLERIDGWLGLVGRTLAAMCRGDSASVPAGDGPTLGQLVGQKLMVRMSGRTPSRALLRRIGRGEVGGIVLLAANIKGPSQLQALTRRLQRAAADGGQPPLLIAVDQEGASLKRVSWAPPTLTVPGMGRLGSVSEARRQGARTGAALRDVGINVDLAPVADIPRSSASFMLQQGRTFSYDAGLTTRLANAFAAGLGSRGVFATMKHFPGIGLVRSNTDRFVQTVTAARSTLDTDLRPYRRAIREGVPIIMLSNATYTAFDRRNAAGWSEAIVDDLLRDELGFAGVTMTDSLDGTAHARGVSSRVLAIKAARAGVDIILTTGSEKTTARTYRELLERAESGAIPREALEDSYQRILDLKARL